MKPIIKDSGHGVKTFEDLVSIAKGGKHEEKYGEVSDEQRRKDIARSLGMETKADEVLSTINNTDWYNAYGMVNDIKDLTPKFGKLLSRLSGGFEGKDLPVSYTVPYDITDYYMQGKDEWEDETRPSFNIQTQTDSSNTLTQKELILEFGVSDKMLAHATDKQLYEKLIQKMVKTFSRTFEGMIINGDIETGATGNVNSDDQAPATTFATEGGASYHALLLDHGIRESAINNSNTENVGAFDSDDMQSVIATLDERYQEEVDDLLFLFNPTTYTTIKTDDGFKLAVNRDRGGAVDSGEVARPWGIDSVVTPLVPKTEADGKVSATGANNTLGQFLVVYKPAIRWGYGQDFNLEVERVVGYGYHLVTTVELSFTILDYANTCGAGINVTLA